jgi:hypothetical protein
MSYVLLSGAEQKGGLDMTLKVNDIAVVSDSFFKEKIPNGTVVRIVSKRIEDGIVYVGFAPINDAKRIRVWREKRFQKL